MPNMHGNYSPDLRPDYSSTRTWDSACYRLPERLEGTSETSIISTNGICDGLHRPTLVGHYSHAFHPVKLHCLSGADFTSTAGCRTFGLRAHPSRRSRSTYIAWTRPQHRARFSSQICKGKRMRRWRLRMFSPRLRRRKRRSAAHQGTHLLQPTSRRWLRALQHCLLMQCPSLLTKFGFRDLLRHWSNHMHKQDCSRWHLYRAQGTSGCDAYGTKTPCRTQGMADRTARGAELSADIDSDEIEDGPMHTPQGTPLPAGPPPPEAVQTQQPISHRLSAAIAGALMQEGVQVNRVLTLLTWDHIGPFKALIAFAWTSHTWATTSLPTLALGGGCSQAEGQQEA